MVSQCTQHSEIYSWLRVACLLVLADFTKYPLVICLRQNWLSAFLAHLLAHTYSVGTSSTCVYNLTTSEQSTKERRGVVWAHINSSDKSVKLFFFFPQTVRSALETALSIPTAAWREIFDKKAEITLGSSLACLVRPFWNLSWGRKVKEQSQPPRGHPERAGLSPLSCPLPGM